MYCVLRLLFNRPYFPVNKSFNGPVIVGNQWLPCDVLVGGAPVKRMNQQAQTTFFLSLSCFGYTTFCLWHSWPFCAPCSWRWGIFSNYYRDGGFCLFCAHAKPKGDLSPVCNLPTFMPRKRNSENFSSGNPSLSVSCLPDAASVYRCM